MIELDASANPLSGYAYEGVWEKFSEPAFKRWIWTLKNSKALLILACLGLLVTLTQTQTWALIRYAILRRTNPVRMDANEPLLNLSQGRAILEALPSKLQMPMRRALRIKTDHHSSVVSMWFGIFALLNIALFAALGVAIALLLSEGVLGAPTVRSRMTDECLNSGKNVYSLVTQQPKSDAIFQQCLDQLNEGCDDQYYLQKPQIHKTRLEICPFSGDICHNGTKPFEITHSNITAYEARVNSRLRWTLSHRLTCVPVSLYSFLIVTTEPPYRFWISVGNSTLNSRLWDDYSMLLNTINGPHAFFNKSSGLQMAYKNGPYDLTVLPKHWAGQDVPMDPELIHADLRRADGMPFLIIHRAGASKYLREVDDPFFAAHNELSFPFEDRPGTFRFFYPDYEATALGCLEQYQYCLASSGFCTLWGSLYNSSLEMGLYWAWTEGDTRLKEIFALFGVLGQHLSIFNYLTERIEWHAMVPLTRPNPYRDMRKDLNNTKEQWVTEVELWFRKGILHTTLSMRNSARYQLTDALNGVSIDIKRKFSLCGRVLFRDGDYTNINWLGFLITTALLIFICFMPCMVEWICRTARTLFKILFDILVELHKIARTLGEFMRNSTRGMWSCAERSLRASFFLQSFFATRRGRPDNYDLGNVLPPSSHYGYDQSEMERDEDIDNTI